VAGERSNEPVAAAAEVRRLEEDWAAAFRNRDYSFMERILAPEFVLASSGRPQGTSVTRREEWLRNLRAQAHVPFEAVVLDVVVAGDTAVATLEARWQRESFLTDTWVRRNGQWQVIFRHSSPRR
jgi:ketosteroid isomerase-like protein